MHNIRLKNAIYLSIIGFLLGFMAITIHHHDQTSMIAACSICKVKTSLSGTLNKIKADSAPAAGMLCFSLTAVFLCFSGILPDRKTVFTHFQIVETYPNKAPPLLS